MATIPLGNFGQTVVQPGRQQRVFGEQAGAITGRAVADLAQTGQDIALKDMQEQTRAREEAYEREAKTKAAMRDVQGQNTLYERANTIADRVKRGELSPDQVDDEWATQASEAVSKSLEGVDSRYAGPLTAQFEAYKSRAKDRISAAVTSRRESETLANLNASEEELERLSQEDRPAAIVKLQTLLQGLGPDAGIPPDQLQKRMQSFKERTAYTQAFTLVRGSSESIAAIEKARKALDSDAFADLDPQKRAALDVQLEGYKTNIQQRQAIAEQRAAARQQVAMNRAQAAFTAAQARTDAGIPDSAEQVAITTQALAGTPFLDTYRALQERAREVGGFGAQPIAAQQAALDQVNAQIAQTGASDSLIKRRDNLQRVLESSKRDYGDDALRAGLQRGVIDALPPIDISSVDAATRTIGQRLQAAQMVQTKTGRPVSPLTNDEAEALGNTINALPVQQRATALATLGRNIGPQAAAGLAAQIDKKDKALALALQFGTAATTEGRTTAEIILRGQQALKDKTVKPDTPAVDGWKGQIAKEVEGAYRNQKQADDVKEAAYLILSGLQSEGTGDVKQAVRLAVGGRIVERNGSKIPLPAGVTEDDFDAKLRSLTPANFANQVKGSEVRVGGQPVPLDAFVQSLPDAQLINAGRGRYNVMHGGRVVTNAEGTPITITAK